MTSNSVTSPRSLRLWPGVAAAVVLILLKFVAPVVLPDGALIGVLGAVAAGAAIGLWWLFLSRAPWAERFGVLALMVLATLATQMLVDPSIRGGMMGMMLPMYLAIPGLGVALVVATAITRRASAVTRRVAIAAAILIACGTFTLLRTDGLKDGAAQITWRWKPTAEERLLAQAPETLPAPPPASLSAPSPDPAPAVAAAEPKAAPTTAVATNPDRGAGAKTTAAVAEIEAATPAAARIPIRWPGFRGPGRDDVVRGVQVNTDWSTTPPVAIWRQPIGPGWSSFAVAGNVLYTQEQRGQDEVVAAYSVTTGKPVWMHKDRVRFYESNGGAGPRSTPTLSSGRVFTLGATGTLNALDAGSGAVLWSRNAVTDAGIKVPGWGIAASPAVVGNVVVTAVSGAMAGYDVGSGTPRWSRKSAGGSYSSPHVVTIDGVTQVMLMAGSGLTSVAPADGKLLWQYAWPGVPIVQPAQIADGDFLITTADAMGALGIRRISVTHGASGWTAAERWTSNGLKPYFNDYVIHKGHAYGFDGNILACISLEDGSRKWKGGRYGNGQFVLLADQDVLLVLSEDGELALVSATPDRFTELARFKAIEGKTWNHPVLLGDLLLVRNGEEMAAFRLSHPHP